MTEKLSAEEIAERWWNENINSPTTTMTNEQWRTNVGSLIRTARREGADPVWEDLAVTRKRIGSFFQRLRKYLGYENWPRHQGDFHDFVLAEIDKKVKAAAAFTEKL